MAKTLCLIWRRLQFLKYFYDVSTPVMVLKLISDIPQKDEDHMSFMEFVQSNSDFSPFVYYLESL